MYREIQCQYMPSSCSSWKRDDWKSNCMFVIRATG